MRLPACSPAASRLILAALLALALPACAARVATPPVVGTPQFPEFVFPAALDADRATATRQQQAWQWLQAGNLRTADREFGAILRRRPGYAPAEAGMGYVELARREPGDALERFDRALQSIAGYAPALVGRAQALVALGRDADALAAYEAAAAADPSLDLGTRIAVLRFRGAGDAVGQARKAAAAGRLEAARTAYLQAIAGSPESGFLYRELGGIEMKMGRFDEALEHLRRAADLEPGDPRALVLIGTIEADKGNAAGALEAFEAAQRIEPAADVQQRIEDLRRRMEYERLPASYRAIAAAPAVTRADAAAVLGVRLNDLLASAQSRQGVVLTDIRGHWATPWILTVVRAGVMEPLPNHTFDPAARLRRADFAQIVLRVLNLAAPRAPGAPSSWRGARVAVSDVPATHPAYPAVSAAVAAGILRLDAGDAFAPSRPVTGPELLEAAGRLEAVIGAAPGRR
jgi:tetratricopeptide (TPR) repeat protein